MPASGSGPARRRPPGPGGRPAGRVRSASSPPIAVPGVRRGRRRPRRVPRRRTPTTWTCSSSGPSRCDRLAEDGAQHRGAAAAGAADDEPGAALGEIELERLPATGGRAGRPVRCAAGCGRPRAGRRGRRGARAAGRAAGARQGRWGSRAAGRAAWRAIAAGEAGQIGVALAGRPHQRGPASRSGHVHRRTVGDGGRPAPAVAATRATCRATAAPLPARRNARPGQVDREERRGGGAEHVPGIGLVGGAQADPQRAVGPDLGGDDAARALGGQHEVDAERPAPLGDGDQPGDERGQLVGQRGELVDDDHEPGEIDGVGQLPRCRRPGVRPRIASRRVSSARQRPQGPGGRLAVEIGHHADGVRAARRPRRRQPRPCSRPGGRSSGRADG